MRKQSIFYLGALTIVFALIRPSVSHADLITIHTGTEFASALDSLPDAGDRFIAAILDEQLNSVSSQNIMATLFNVFRNSIDEQNEDKEYWINKLKEMNDIAEGLAGYIRELNESLAEANSADEPETTQTILDEHNRTIDTEPIVIDPTTFELYEYLFDNAGKIAYLPFDVPDEDVDAVNTLFFANDIPLQFAVTPVPEPGTLALLVIGLFGMGLARRRRKV